VEVRNPVPSPLQGAVVYTQLLGIGGQGSREAGEVWFTQIVLSLSLTVGISLISSSDLGANKTSIESKLVYKVF
jgi:hypothetical protein